MRSTQLEPPLASLVLAPALLLCCGLAAARAGAESPLARAEALLGQLSRTPEASRRAELLAQAEAQCEAAIRTHPDAAAPRLALARVLAVADPARPELCRPGACERAVEVLEQARARDRDGIAAEQIASELGIALSRLGRFEEALTEYDRAMSLVESEAVVGLDRDAEASPVLWGNSAETLMALGRLKEAILRYRRAEAVSEPGSVAWELALWGLAVAYDRDGQLEQARSAARRALGPDPTMARLSDEGVFFEPPGDKRYYEALGHEVAGDLPQASAAWRRFLSESPTSRWRGRAQAHLAVLDSAAPRGRGGRAPRAGGPAEREPQIAIEQLLPLPVGDAPSALLAGLRARDQELELCWARAARQGPRPQGAMVLMMDLAASGSVRAAHAVSSELPDSLTRCVRLAAENWRLPGAERQLAARISFSPPP